MVSIPEVRDLLDKDETESDVENEDPVIPVVS